MEEVKVSLGLYRHFKGSYYFVQNVVKNAVTDEWECLYFNVCHPEFGVFTRPVSQWFDTDTDKGKICERWDNQTGQQRRFEKVDSINFQVSSISTEQLLRELTSREDSPIRDLDIPGAESKAFSRDYVCGVPMYDEVHGNYLNSWNSFEDKDEAVKYLKKHSMPGKPTSLFKRVLLKEEI